MRLTMSTVCLKTPVPRFAGVSGLPRVARSALVPAQAATALQRCQGAI